MRIVVDAMGTEFGGVRTYVDGLLPAWARCFPADELHVVTPAGSGIGADHTVHEVVVGRPGVVRRPLAQSRVLPDLARRVGADAVLATIPATTMRHPGVPLGVVVHDLRHDLRPDQFSRTRRALRRVSYRRAYRLADVLIGVSARTLGDLHRLYPETAPRRSAVVHHGADHVRSWPVPHRDGPAIAFAHHSNKNPELLVEAWRLLGEAAPSLLVLGVGASARPALQAAVDAAGVTSRVTLAPYLDDAAFADVVAGAALVVFPSDFEGFGLPVLEAMATGKPVVVGPDPAVLEIAGGHATVMAGFTGAGVAEAVERAGALEEAQLAAARAWAETFTWDGAARKTRAALAAAADRPT